jgi:hypothetical protein
MLERIWDSLSDWVCAQFARVPSSALLPEPAEASQSRDPDAVCSLKPCSAWLMSAPRLSAGTCAEFSCWTSSIRVAA